MTEQAEKFLNISLVRWDDNPFEERKLHTINRFKPLMTRIEMKTVDAMIADEATSQQTKETSTAQTTAASSSNAKTITLADFQKLDLRVARIVAAKEVDGADKRLELTVDLGREEPRKVLAGIKSAYSSADLVGRHVVVVANLEPKKMRFGTSHGMVLAAGDGTDLFLLTPDQGAKAGLKVK